MTKTDKKSIFRSGENKKNWDNNFQGSTFFVEKPFEGKQFIGTTMFWGCGNFFTPYIHDIAEILKDNYFQFEASFTCLRFLFHSTLFLTTLTTKPNNKANEKT